MHPSITPMKSLAVAAAGGALALTGGMAAAQAGMLPGAAQDSAQEMLDTIGVQVPGAEEHSADHADTRGRSADAPAGGASDAAGHSEAPGTLPDAAAFGRMISELARSTDSGPGKGEVISEAARTNGQAGQQGPASSPPQQQSTGGDPPQPPAPEGERGQSSDKPPVATPNDGGTDTADQASADEEEAPSTSGTGTAGSASGGHSTAGSGNRP